MPWLYTQDSEVISIHSLRMEGDCGYAIKGVTTNRISIHSLRMEGDDITFLHFDVQPISIHSLRMEGDR